MIVSARCSCMLTRRHPFGRRPWPQPPTFLTGVPAGPRALPRRTSSSSARLRLMRTFASSAASATPINPQQRPTNSARDLYLACSWDIPQITRVTVAMIRRHAVLSLLVMWCSTSCNSRSSSSLIDRCVLRLLHLMASQKMTLSSHLDTRLYNGGRDPRPLLHGRHLPLHCPRLQLLQRRNHLHRRRQRHPQNLRPRPQCPAPHQVTTTPHRRPARHQGHRRAHRQQRLPRHRHARPWS